MLWTLFKTLKVNDIHLKCLILNFVRKKCIKIWAFSLNYSLDNHYFKYIQKDIKEMERQRLREKDGKIELNREREGERMFILYKQTLISFIKINKQ